MFVIAARRCTADTDCLPPNRACRGGICQPSTCIENANCATGTTCVGRQCGSNGTEYFFAMHKVDHIERFALLKYENRLEIVVNGIKYVSLCPC